MSIGRALGALALAGGVALGPVAAGAEDNCANEFRSGKLYFSQKLFEKSVQRFARSVELCPEKAEYHAHYAIALSQLWGMRLDAAAADPAALAAVSDSTIAAFTLAANEFEQSLKLDNTKKHQKFVRDNRQHFWVERYNLGLKLTEEKKFEGANIQFRLARILDPKEPKAYGMGANALIAIQKKAEAANLVEEGLALAPDDATLKKLQISIFREAAGALVDSADANHDAACAEKAEGLYTQVMDKGREAGEAEDPNLYFNRGVARSAKASILAAADTSGQIPAAATEAYKGAAEDFAKAASLVSPENPDDAEFYKGALFNQIQALVYSGQEPAAMPLIKTYLGLDWKDIPVWQFYTQALDKGGNKAGAVSALVVSRALTANAPVPVADAVKSASGDASKAMTELGQPEFVFSYQEKGLDEEQIETWIWPTKKTAKSYIRGVENGEITW